jgi:hypothetical protein
MMQKVTISKEEYDTLLSLKLKYEYLQQIIKEDLFSSPPTKDADAVIAMFSKTGRYNKAFLKGLEKGLKRSSYFKKK